MRASRGPKNGLTMLRNHDAGAGNYAVYDDTLAFRNKALMPWLECMNMVEKDQQ